MAVPVQSGPGVWYGPDVEKRESEWLFKITSEELNELQIAADKLVEYSNRTEENEHFLSIQAIDNLDNFDIPKLKSRLSIFLEQNLNNGLGFFLWRGLPVKSWSHKRTSAAFLLIGKCIGNLRQQNAKGHVLGHVKDLGLASDDPNVRVYQTRERQTFHTDSCDVVGLLCLQTAKSGGLSSLVSSSTVFNELLKINDGELAAELLQPIAKDRRGEIPKGSLPYFNLPVYNWYEGYLSAIYQRQYINSAQRFPDAKRLTEKTVDALNTFDSLCDDPRLNFSMSLQPGDMQFVNNHALLHDRTAFEDWDQVDKRRHLLRIWVAPKNARPLPEVYAQRYGSVVVGDRGGVGGIQGVVPIAPLHP